MEFALVAPLLLMLVFGIISYGYMLSFRQALSQAAAEGARAAAVSTVATSRESDAVKAVNEGLRSYGVTCAAGKLVKGSAQVGTCAVSAPASCAGHGTAPPLCLSVTVDYAYRAHPLTPAFPGLGTVLPDRLAYTSSARVS
ncbi:TadE family protein [Nocardioides sp. Arc9.136]|uniref:TadE family protein n=1 Tax=Nocardioides sp. Arc9.136 TaxID=2996826 RepID=UPI002665CFE4|nr:TadE/TadG family type IV pilus assembly protein [Nocardioides sp. Arc9.136]WKN49927.1 pilus assembly protein [Nocardioides sp. Arc9.136]